MVSGVDEVLDELLRGAISAPVALVRVLVRHPDLPEVEAVLAARPDGTALRVLLSGHRPACERICSIVRRGIDPPLSGDQDPVAATRDFFDGLARTAPVSSVALYALEDRALLDRATEEIVALLDAWNLLGPDRRVLDLGCGMGRVARALHSRVESVLAIDLSPEMVARAREACAGLPSVTVALGSGRDLGGVPDRSLDGVFSVDAFPYLRRAGEALVRTHLAEIARVLIPGGLLAILNASYRADPALDARELAAWGAPVGLALEIAGAAPFRLWDGRAFRLRRA